MMKRKLGVLVVFAGLMAVLLAVGLMAEPVSPAVAGVSAVPTPVGAQAGGGDWVMATYSLGGDFTNVFTTATGSGLHDPAYTAVDLSWTLDMSGTLGVTCTLGFSNDNTNWDEGEHLFYSATVDTDVVTQTELFGRYSRVVCTEFAGDSENTYTVTIVGKLMN